MKEAKRAVLFNVVCAVVMSIVAYATHGFNFYTVGMWIIWAWIIGFSIKQYVKTKKQINELKGRKDDK